jgi:hypothetical protein
VQDYTLQKENLLVQLKELQIKKKRLTLGAPRAEPLQKVTP